MLEVDWMVHMILGDPLSFHTHGLDRHGSLEIEILLPLSKEQGIMLCNCIGESIAQGLKIEDGQMVEHIFNVPIYFFKTMPLHGEKEVLRAVFTDELGRYPWEPDCAEPYKRQIQFNEDKVFIIEIKDIKRVVECGTKIGSPFHGFIKRSDKYIRVLQYISEGELIRTGPYTLDGYQQLLTTLRDVYYINGISIVCIDSNKNDPINKEFYDWKAECERHDNIRKDIEDGKIQE